jgi:hypothetical protein
MRKKARNYQRLNIGLEPALAQALKEYCVKTTGGLKDLSVLMNEAVRMYLESKGIEVESEPDDAAKNPCKPFAALALA